MIASADTHSAIPSRSTTWVATSAGRRSRDRATDASSAGSTDEYVPTAPEIFATATAARARRSRSRDRASPKAKSATRCPNTSGSAWTPWVRPTRSVSRCSRPRSRSAATSASALASSTSQCLDQLHRERGVEQVGRGHARSGRTRRPPAGSVLSAQAVRKAITSCWVTSSIAATAAGVGGGASSTGCTRPGRHRAGLGVRGQHLALDPAPQLVLVGLAPDRAHLRQRVALDHATSLPAGRRGGRGLPG